MVSLNVLEVIKEVDGSFIIKLLKWVEGWVEKQTIKNYICLYFRILLMQ